MTEDKASDQTKSEPLDQIDPSIEDAEIITGGANDPEAEVNQTTGTARLWPLIVGGVVAAGIGYGTAVFLDDGPDDRIPALLQAQTALQSDLAQLQHQIDTAPIVRDLTGDFATLETRFDTLTTTLDRLETQTVQLADRITVLEKRPLTEVVAPGAIAAYQAELDSLKTAAQDQLQAIQNVADAARKDILTAKEQASKLEQAAQQAARKGVAISALNTIKSALLVGNSYAPALDTFMANTDMSFPTAISDHAESGVSPLTTLQSDFPDMARAALAVARETDDATDGNGGLGGFFKSQLNVRSLTPQEGDGPDAVLSRAEAAVINGDIAVALMEIAKLPDTAQNILAPWIKRANIRETALIAAEIVAQQLSQN